MLERYEPNVRLVFARNPNYFVSGLPYADGIEVTVDEDPSSRLSAWIAGKYDFAPEYGQCVRRLDLDVAKGRKPGLKTQEFVVQARGCCRGRRDPFPPRGDGRIRARMEPSRKGPADACRVVLLTPAAPARLTHRRHHAAFA